MALDKPTRNALAKMVAACRERLTADISDQLQSAFGLYPDGTRLDVARTEADKRATAELRALLDYFIASDASSAKNPQNAYQRLVRDVVEELHPQVHEFGMRMEDAAAVAQARERAS